MHNDHFKISIVKSFIRIFGCLIGIVESSLTIIGGSMILAEVLGILEEVKDDRK